MHLRTDTYQHRGGGNNENDIVEQFNSPLRWIMYEAMDYGLKVKPFEAWDKLPKIKLEELRPSMTGFWRILEILPLQRPSYRSQHGTVRW